MLTIDANVWIAALDKHDRFTRVSRKFLAEIADQQLRVYLPEFARVENACALARKRQSAITGERLMNTILSPADVEFVSHDARFLAHALNVGTQCLIRGADALYVATANLHSSLFISWDDELIQRASAMTPSDWLAANT